MATILRGKIKDGKVELYDPSAAIEGAEVTVMQPDWSNGAKIDQRIYFGMFAGPVETTEEDFKLAEWHGDPDDGLDWTGA